MTLTAPFLPSDEAINARIAKLCAETELTVPDEPIEANPRSFDIQHFGFQTWADLFTPRQIAALMTYVKHIRLVHLEMLGHGYDLEMAKVITTYFGLTLDKLADTNNSLCRWEPVARMSTRTVRNVRPYLWFGILVKLFPSLPVREAGLSIQKGRLIQST